MENLNPLADIPFKIKENQSNAEDYAASDFLCAKLLNIEPKIDPVRIDFKQLCGEITIELVAGDGFTNEDIANLVTGITLKDVITNATVNLVNNTITSGTQRSDVIAYRQDIAENARFKVLLPPQVITNAKTFLELNIGDKLYPVTTNLNVVSGKWHHMDLKIDKDFSSIQMTLNGVTSREQGGRCDGTAKVVNPIHKNIKKYCAAVFDTDYWPMACFNGATIGSFVCEPSKGHDYFNYAHKPNKRADITNGMEMSVRFKNLYDTSNRDYQHNVYVYTDWNNDGDFSDTNELVGVREIMLGTQYSVQDLKYTLHIPAGAISPTTMRIYSASPGNNEVSFGCGMSEGTVYDVPIYF